MSQPQTTMFRLKQVKALLAKARSAAEPTEIEIDDGLSTHLLDAMNVMAVFSPPLRIKPRWTLVTQQYTDGANGNGFTWAIPADGPQPDLFLTEWPDDSTRPEGALEPISVIDGEGSPWSYMCASLLARELAELGAMWHGCEWSTHELYGGTSLPGDWTYTGPRPASYNPTVTLSQEGATVTFYTYTGLGQDRIIRHTDFYRVGQGYQFKSETWSVAYGSGGFVF